MNYWSRKDTKDWIAQLEDRIEDIEHYIDKTMAWCDERDIDDERVVFLCLFLTCVWVSQLRCEPITYLELMEMLGVTNITDGVEKIYELDDRYVNLTHKEMLAKAVFDYYADLDN